MSTLPPELQPGAVHTSGAAAVADCQQQVADALANDDAWLFIRVKADGDATMLGSYSTVQQAAAFVLASIEAWRMTAEMHGDRHADALARAITKVLGGSTEYVSGGLVPRRS